VAVDTDEPDGWSAEESLDELAQLARTAGTKVVGRLVQKLDAPNRQTYVGKGKIDELLGMKSSPGYDVAIFDDELTPMQQQNLEKALNVKVIDRVALILDIFARRARTREGKLQVELAQHQYFCRGWPGSGATWSAWAAASAPAAPANPSWKQTAALSAPR
jgi:GTP-binding protein HflX